MAGMKLSQAAVDAIKAKALPGWMNEAAKGLKPAGTGMKSTLKAAGAAKATAKAKTPVRAKNVALKSKSTRRRVGAPIRGGGTANRKPAPVQAKKIGGPRMRAGGGEVPMPPSAPIAATRKIENSTPHGDKTIEQVMAERKPVNRTTTLSQQLAKQKAPVTGDSTPHGEKTIEQVVAERGARKSKPKQGSAWTRYAK